MTEQRVAEIEQAFYSATMKPEEVSPTIAALTRDWKLLYEFREAIEAVERGITDFSLHADTVMRLRRATDAIRRSDGLKPLWPAL